jgi:hypothetical protein
VGAADRRQARTGQLATFDLLDNETFERRGDSEIGHSTAVEGVEYRPSSSKHGYICTATCAL